jgi:hypothetical protein
MPTLIVELACRCYEKKNGFCNVAAVGMHVVRIQAGARLMLACRDVGMGLVSLRSVGLTANLKRTLLKEHYRLLPLLTAALLSETPPLS